MTLTRSDAGWSGSAFAPSWYDDRHRPTKLKRKDDERGRMNSHRRINPTVRRYRNYAMRIHGIVQDGEGDASFWLKKYSDVYRTMES
jgi:hypothetical protein